MTLMAPPRAPRPPAARRLLYGDERACRSCGAPATLEVIAAPRRWPGADIRLVTCSRCDAAERLTQEGTD